MLGKGRMRRQKKTKKNTVSKGEMPDKDSGGNNLKYDREKRIIVSLMRK